MENGELAKSLIGSFEAGDSIIAGDPTSEGLVFGSKPGSWKVYKTEDDTNTTELLIVHSDIKSFREDKFSWIAEDSELEIISGQCGFYDLNTFQAKEDLGDVTGNPLNHYVGDKGCLVPSGYGEGLYNLFLSYNKDGDVIAAKVVFIEEIPEDRFDVYADDDWVDTEYLGLWDKEDFEFGDANEEDYEEE